MLCEREHNAMASIKIVKKKKMNRSIRRCYTLLVVAIASYCVFGIMLHAVNAQLNTKLYKQTQQLHQLQETVDENKRLFTTLSNNYQHQVLGTKD